MTAFKSTFIILTSLFLLGIAGTASAMIVADLTIPNVSSMPEMDYATASLEAFTPTASVGYDYGIHVKFDLADGLGTTLNGGSNFGMDKVSFNTDLLEITTRNSSNLPIVLTNFDPETWKITFNENISGFGRFDIELTDPTRCNREDHLYFDILSDLRLEEPDFFVLSDSSNGGENEGPAHFAAHVAGFDWGSGCNGVSSVFVRDNGPREVPEPGTLILLGAGMAGLALYRRRKK